MAEQTTVNNPTLKRKGRKISTILKDSKWTLISYAGLVLCIVLFGILSPVLGKVNIFSGIAFKNIMRRAIVYAVVGCGAVFVYSLGAMDISIGAQMSLYCVLMVRIYNVAGSNTGAMILGVLVVLLIALVCGAFNSVLAEVLKIKPIIASLFLQFFLYGISMLLFVGWCGESQSMGFNAGTASKTAFAPFSDITIMVILLVVLVLVYTYIFRFTKVGKYTRAMGANQLCAQQAGANLILYRMIAYLIMGVAIVVGSVMYLSVNSSVTYNSAQGYEMDIIVCLILGGMPISGGMKSRISSAIVGAFTYALIKTCFIYIGIPSSYTNIFVAIIYIVVVILTCRDKGRVLPK